jgi:hypothetical protein
MLALSFMPGPVFHFVLFVSPPSRAPVKDVKVKDLDFRLATPLVLDAIWLLFMVGIYWKVLRNCRRSALDIIADYRKQLSQNDCKEILATAAPKAP